MAVGARVMATRGLVRAAGSCCSTGARRTIDWRIVATGNCTPSWLQNEDAHAPPASTAVRVLMVPASVTTPLSRPPSISMPRAAQFWWTVPPSFMSAAATAGAALAVSAVPSLGEKTPPFQARPVAWPRSEASRPLSMCVVTPAVVANSRHLAQPAIWASSLLRYSKPQRVKPVSSPLSAAN